MRLNHIQVLIKKESNKLESNVIFLLIRRGSVLSFDILHVLTFIQQNILGAMKLVKMLAGKELICVCVYFI